MFAPLDQCATERAFKQSVDFRPRREVLRVQLVASVSRDRADDRRKRMLSSEVGSDLIGRRQSVPPLVLTGLQSADDCA